MHPLKGTTMDNIDYDLKNIVTKRRLVGLWRIMAGYRWLYLLAIVAIGLSALMRSTIYYALGYFVDDVLSADGNILPQSLLVGAGHPRSGHHARDVDVYQRPFRRANGRRHYSPTAQLPV
jgi:ABC-type multidrug transport system fused ATPase/permease subunit